MSIKSYYNEKLSKVLFLDIKSVIFERYFGVTINTKMYMPINSNRLTDSVIKEEEMKGLPISYFIEGMFYVIGLDPDFKFMDDYVKLIQSIPDSLKFIRGEIFKNIKQGSYEEAYIKLKGLSLIEKSEDIFSRLLELVDYIRNQNLIFVEEEMNIIDEAKKIPSFPDPYFYEAVLKRDQNDFESALHSYNIYITMGGKASEEVVEAFKKIRDVENYRKGRKVLYENPVEALKLLLPLLESLSEDASVFYHVAVAYRILKNHEKAIYYLNEAMAIDDALAEVVNELGINFAALGDFDRALLYFRKAFEATKEIGICTNIIMCYLNKGDLEQARLHVEIAHKLNPEDEILKEIEKIMEEKK